MLRKGAGLGLVNGNVFLGAFSESAIGFLIIDCHYSHPTNGDYSKARYIIQKYGNRPIVVRKVDVVGTEKFIYVYNNTHIFFKSVDSNCCSYPEIIDYGGGFGVDIKNYSNIPAGAVDY